MALHKCKDAPLSSPGFIDAAHLLAFEIEIALLLQGFIIRGLVLMNPHNPLADIYTTKEMVGFLEFAKRYFAFHPRGNSATCSSLKGSFQKHSTHTEWALTVLYDQDSCPMCRILSALNDFLLPFLIVSILAWAATVCATQSSASSLVSLPQRFPPDITQICCKH